MMLPMAPMLLPIAPITSWRYSITALSPACASACAACGMSPSEATRPASATNAAREGRGRRARSEARREAMMHGILRWEWRGTVEREQGKHTRAALTPSGSAPRDAVVAAAGSSEWISAFAFPAGRSRRALRIGPLVGRVEGAKRCRLFFDPRVEARGREGNTLDSQHFDERSGYVFGGQARIEVRDAARRLGPELELEGRVDRHEHFAQALACRRS